MKVAFDIDGVLTNILEFQREEGTKYFAKKGKKIVKPNALTVEEMFDVSKDEAFKFWAKNTVKYCLTYPANKEMLGLIRRLNKKGDTTYCITKRMLADKDNIMGIGMRKLVKTWLKNQGVEINEENLVFVDSKKDPNKEIAIKTLHIDVMIEDDVKNVEVLDKCTNVIVVDEEHNRDFVGKNTKRAYNVDEIEDYIEDIRVKKTTLNKDKNKKLTGYASIDKPYKDAIDERPFLDNNMSMYDFYRLNNKYTGDLTAIEYFNQTVSFEELNKRIDNAAKALMEMGIKKGDRVASIMPNQPETVIFFFAANKIGAEWITFNPKEFIAPSDAFIETFNSIHAKITLVTDVYAEGYYKVKDKLNVKNTIVAKPNITMKEPLKHGYNVEQAGLKFVKKHNVKSIINKLRIYKNEILLKKTMLDKYTSIVPEMDNYIDGMNYKFKRTDLERTMLHIEKELRNTSLFKPKFDYYNISWEDFEELGKNSDLRPISVGNANNFAVGICTGGTTGIPKIVRHTNKALNYTQIISGNVTTNYHTGDKWYAILPNFHIFGFVNAFFVPLSSGMAISQIPKPDLNTIGKEITKSMPEHIALVPAAIEAMFEYFSDRKELYYVLKNIKTISCGGGALSPEKEEKYNKILKEAGSDAQISNGFGMTETCSAIIYPNDKDRTPGTIGMPVYGTDVKIMEKDTNKEVKYGEIGEIYVSGPTVLLEYFDNPVETSKVLITDEDGKVWLNTKDLGTINAKGQVTFIGRSKNMIEKNGEKIYPEMIEATLKRNSYVKDAIVCGPKNDEEIQIVYSYVILNDGMYLNDDIINSLNKTLSDNGLKLSIPDKYKQIEKEDIMYTKLAKVDNIAMTKVAEAELRREQRVKLLKK